MADTNEAQLLSDLLRDIAHEDAHVDATHLEARVMAAVARSTPSSLGATRLTRWAAAAAVAVAALVPATYWMKTQVPVEKAQVKVNTTEEVIAQESNAGGRTEAKGTARANGLAKANGPAKAGHYVLPRVAKSVNTRSAPIAPSRITPSPITEPPVTESPIAQSPITQLPFAQSSITQSRDEFVPLMPMTEQEMSGPFQIVRVQMPRASLGALRSPLDHPNEIVEADVLLGEDGMARAIRVSTSGSVYPWRSR